MDNHPPGDNYPLKRVIIIHYVQIHLPKSSPSGFASHGHIGPVSGDAQTQVANSRQKTLSVLCKLSNLSTLFKTIQFGRTLDFFEPIPVSASHYDSKIQEVFVPDLPLETLQKAVGTANKWGCIIQWSCPNIRSQPTVDGDWIRYLIKEVRQGATESSDTSCCGFAQESRFHHAALVILWL